jgi:hypothetical protein
MHKFTWLEDLVNDIDEFDDVVGAIYEEASNNAVKVTLVLVGFVDLEKITGGH